MPPSVGKLLTLGSGNRVTIPRNATFSHYYDERHSTMSANDMQELHNRTTEMMHEATDAQMSRKRTMMHQDTDIQHGENGAVQRAQRARLHEIIGPRSAQGLITLSAVFEPSRELGMELPAHSLVFAATKDQQGGHVVIENFGAFEKAGMPKPIVGTSLEDALDATKLLDEHVSRRTVAVAVGGVVALHCPVEFAKEFMFGDPVYVSKPYYAKFHDNVKMLVPSNTINRSSYVCKIGTFVEQVDAKRGGIRLQLDIGEWSLGDAPETVNEEAEKAKEGMTKAIAAIQRFGMYKLMPTLNVLYTYYRMATTYALATVLKESKDANLGEKKSWIDWVTFTKAGSSEKFKFLNKNTVMAIATKAKDSAENLINETYDDDKKENALEALTRVHDFVMNNDEEGAIGLFHDIEFDECQGDEDVRAVFCKQVAREAGKFHTLINFAATNTEGNALEVDTELTDAQEKAIDEIQKEFFETMESQTYTLGEISGFFKTSAATAAAIGAGAAILGMLSAPAVVAAAPAAAALPAAAPSAAALPGAVAAVSAAAPSAATAPAAAATAAALISSTGGELAQNTSSWTNVLSDIFKSSESATAIAPAPEDVALGFQEKTTLGKQVNDFWTAFKEWSTATGGSTSSADDQLNQLYELAEGGYKKFSS